MNSEFYINRLAHSLIAGMVSLVSMIAGATPLILESDFENNSTKPWNILSWGGEARRSLTSLECATGSGCMLFNVSSQPDTVVLRQDITTRQATEYLGSAWLRADQSMDITVRIRKNDPPYTIWGQRTVPVGNAWQKVTFLAAAGDTSSARFEFSLSNTNINAYIDNVSLSESEGIPFESGGSTATIGKSFFGMHLNKGHVVNEWEPVASVNVGLVRLWDTGTDWVGIEAQKGRFDWTRIDLYLDRIKRYIPDAKIIYTFGRVPGWANGSGTVADPPLNLGDWTNFVTRLVERCGSRIDYYEMWNEFDYSGFWSGSPQQLLELNKEAYRIIKEVDPTARILMPSITNHGMDSLDKYLRIGGGNYADAASIHIYTFEDEIESSFIFVNAVKDLLSSYSLSSMPIFNTEGAVMVESPPIDEKTAAARVSTYYLMSALSGLENSNWYFWENSYGTGRVELVSDFSYYDKLTPAGIAYRETASWLVNTRISRYTRNDSNGLHVVELTRGGVLAGLVVWSEQDINDYVPESNRKIVFLKKLDGTKLLYSGQPIDVSKEPVFLEYNIPLAAPVLDVE